MLAVLLAAAGLMPAEALGAGQVERELAGCVVEGRFFSIWRDPATGKPDHAYPMRIDQEPSLAAYEGKAVSMRGTLMPGDLVYPENRVAPFVVKATCEEDSLAVIRKTFVMDYIVAGSKAAATKNFAEALRLVNLALALDKAFCGTYLARAEIQLRKGDIVSAMADITVVRRHACVQPEGLNFLVLEDIGALLEQAGKRADVIDLYTVGLESCRSEPCRKSLNRSLKQLTGK
jgi:hypothetical protein